MNFDNHVFKFSKDNKHLSKEPYFKVYAFMTISNENAFSWDESYLHKVVRFDTTNC